MIRQFDLSLPHGVSLACRAAGAGRPRALLLHGFPEAAFVWDEVMLQLAPADAPQLACVAPNLRGYPGSSAPTEVAAYRAKTLVADIVATIEALAGAPGTPLDLLVAHDWGGALAWNLAALRPDLIKQLLIINSPHPATFLRELRHSPAQQAASAYMNFLCRPDAQALLAENGFARLWPFLGQGHATPAWLSPALRAQYEATWRQGLSGPINYYRASPLRPPAGPADPVHTLVLPDEAVHVHVPTTVLWGERDAALLPGLLQGLEHWVPGVQVLRVPDASHWIVHERPDLVVAQIRRLLG
ncbi:MAG: alpha/beta fold hydrolase [Rubrivivax sp.]|nr:alpha/beta fold hydrolase [Rubrivivax sp.]